MTAPGAVLQTMASFFYNFYGNAYNEKEFFSRGFRSHSVGSSGTPSRNSIGDLVMAKFIRKILGGDYGLMTVPKPVFDSWHNAGFTHLEMLFDEHNNTLVICPV